MNTFISLIRGIQSSIHFNCKYSEKEDLKKWKIMCPLHIVQSIIFFYQLLTISTAKMINRAKICFYQFISHGGQIECIIWMEMNLSGF